MSFLFCFFSFLGLTRYHSLIPSLMHSLIPFMIQSHGKVGPENGSGGTLGWVPRTYEFSGFFQVAGLPPDISHVFCIRVVKACVFEAMAKSSLRATKVDKCKCPHPFGEEK